MRSVICFLWLCLLAFPANAAMDCPSRSDGEIIIASFNVYLLGNVGKKYADPALMDEPGIPDRINVLADVIASGSFDLVSLQEVKKGAPGKAAVRDLCIALEARHGLVYQYFASGDIGQGFRMRESMAYIFREGVVVPRHVPGTNKLTQIIEIPGRDLVRTYWTAGEFDFTLISAHLAWGNTHSYREAGFRKVDDIFSTEIPSEFSNDADIIVLGDFNRFGGEQVAVKELKFDGDFLAPNVTIFDPEFNQVEEVWDMDYKKLGLPGNDPQWLSTTCSNNNTMVYDIILLSPAAAENFTGGSSGGRFGQDWGILHFDEKGGCGYIKGLERLGGTQLKELVSDHRPLWMKFDVRSP